MAKKSFSGGLASLLEPSVKSEPEIKEKNLDTSDKEVLPAKNASKNSLSSWTSSVSKRSARNGTRDGAIRMTFIVDEEMCNKIRALAFYDRVPIGIVLEDIVNAYLETLDPTNLENALSSYELASSARFKNKK